MGREQVIRGLRRGLTGWCNAITSRLGKLSGDILTDNALKWSGDHCMAADEVPGVLLCNRPIRKQNPTLLDMAPTFLGLFGIRKPPEMRGRDIFT